MRRLGVFVGDDGNWSFFGELHVALQKRYEVEVFAPRVYATPLLYGRLNRWSRRRGIQRLLARSDVAFFEWATDLLAEATRGTPGCPLVARLHKYELFVWAQRIDWRRVDRIVLVSEGMRRRFCSRFPEHAERTRVVRNACAVPPDPPTDRPFGARVAMVCRLHPVKRVYEAILTLDRLRRRGLALELHVAGEAPPGGWHDEYVAALVSLVERLGLGDRVTFHGWVEDIPSWLGDMDVFVSMSCFEGLQVALLEAMAAGCHCLGHAWDGAEEVLPPEYLFVDGSELEEKVLAYAAATDEQRLASRRGLWQIACDRFDRPRQQQEILDVVEEVVAASAIGRP